MGMDGWIEETHLEWVFTRAKRRKWRKEAINQSNRCTFTNWSKRIRMQIEEEDLD
jgi:hypothetical protein